MKIHELKSSRKSQKRVGRGISAGGGKTAGRGTKGQNSRTGGRVRPGFEGGQNPLYMRIPKLSGFKSYKTPKEVVTTGQLNNLKASNVNSESLHKAGLTSDPHASVKIIFRGDVTKSLKLQVQAISARALTSVEKAGGSVEVVARPQRKAVKTPANK